MTLFRSIVGLFLGLLIQLSQVAAHSDASYSKACGNNAAMSCCEGHRTCPCAKESDAPRKPAPLAPAAMDLKLLLAKAVEEFGFADREDFAIEPVKVAIPRPELRHGYAGVPLSVAYCSFVI